MGNRVGVEQYSSPRGVVEMNGAMAVFPADRDAIEVGQAEEPEF